MLLTCGKRGRLKVGRDKFDKKSKREGLHIATGTLRAELRQLSCPLSSTSPVWISIGFSPPHNVSLACSQAIVKNLARIRFFRSSLFPLKDSPNGAHFRAGRGQTRVGGQRGESTPRMDRGDRCGGNVVLVVRSLSGTKIAMIPCAGPVPASVLVWHLSSVHRRQNREGTGCPLEKKEGG